MVAARVAWAPPIRASTAVQTAAVPGPAGGPGHAEPDCVRLPGARPPRARPAPARPGRAPPLPGPAGTARPEVPDARRRTEPDVGAPEPRACPCCRSTTARPGAGPRRRTARRWRRPDGSPRWTAAAAPEVPPAEGSPDDVTPPGRPRHARPQRPSEHAVRGALRTTPSAVRRCAAVRACAATRAGAAARRHGARKRGSGACAAWAAPRARVEATTAARAARPSPAGARPHGRPRRLQRPPRQPRRPGRAPSALGGREDARAEPAAEAASAEQAAGTPQTGWTVPRPARRRAHAGAPVHAVGDALPTPRGSAQTS